MISLGGTWGSLDLPYRKLGKHTLIPCPLVSSYFGSPDQVGPVKAGALALLPLSLIVNFGKIKSCFQTSKTSHLFGT